MTGISRAMDRIQRHFCTLEEKLPAEMRAPFTGSDVVHREREEEEKVEEGKNVTDRTNGL